ncbi:nucleoid-associated protein [Cardiobacterium hominis]|uniref:nucleoid-associated protein n=1 Tax=Cardiobacterium hominis TaxID=2718 RepID=UPI0020648B62|nr:nucleoid-associated protein [Cardiobacterium hominis]DAX36669.1 MAG TPA: 37-kD nucleoid-associated bacterial protein [Caudoviricetes sp.]
MANSDDFEILAGVIHRIVKPQFAGEEDSHLDLRDALHSKNEHLNKFVENAEDILLKSGSNRSSSGGFDTDKTLSKILADTDFSFENDEKYLNVSQKLLEGLFYHVSKKSATTGEYVPVIFYRKNGRKYLLLTLISLNNYLNINEQGELSDIAVIDKDALKVGVRVDLQAMQEHYHAPPAFEAQPYVRWIERRNSRLPDYIQDYIPVGTKIDDRKSTRELMVALDRYLDETLVENDEVKEKARTEILQMMRQKQQQDEHLQLEEDIDPLLHNMMQREGIDAVGFQTWRQENGVDLNSFFKPEKRALDGFEKFKIVLPESGVTVRGNQDELGRKVKITTSDGQHYLTIGIDEAEKNRLQGQYPQLNKR